MSSFFPLVCLLPSCPVSLSVCHSVWLWPACWSVWQWGFRESAQRAQQPFLWGTSSGCSREERGAGMEREMRLASTCHPSLNDPHSIQLNMAFFIWPTCESFRAQNVGVDLCYFFVLTFGFSSQGRHGRRPGEEESDVDIEGFEEEDDGKPKTPAPVRKRLLMWNRSFHFIKQVKLTFLKKY